jgi:hypothetical protein
MTIYNIYSILYESIDITTKFSIFKYIITLLVILFCILYFVFGSNLCTADQTNIQPNDNILNNLKNIN